MLSAWIAALALGVLLLGTLSPATSNCRVEVKPAVSFWPLRFLRADVWVEPSDIWREADLTLYDPDGEPIRTSRVWDQGSLAPGTLEPKHTQVDWNTLPPADPGPYVVVLRVTTAQPGIGCQATARLTVADSGH